MIVGKEFLEIMFPLGTAKIDYLNILDYVEGVAKVNIGTMNVDQEKTDKASRYHWETPGGALAGPHVKCGPVIPCHMENMSHQEN